MNAGCVLVAGLLLEPEASALVPPPGESLEDAESPSRPTEPPAESPEAKTAIAEPASTPPVAPSPTTPEDPTAAAEPTAVAEPAAGETAGAQVPPPKAVDDARAPTRPQPPEEPGAQEDAEANDPVRRGFVLSGVLGYAGCGKLWCQGYRGGFGGGAELGLRFNRVMPLVGWSSGIGPYDRATLQEELGVSLTGSPTVKTHVFGVGAALFPLGKETRRIDPHFDARIGYGAVRLEFEGEGLRGSERAKRGVFTLGGGVDGFVTQNFILGVRVDVHMMFAGEVCYSVADGNGNSGGGCQASDDLESRVDPRDWPLPFSVMMQFRRIWGFEQGPRSVEQLLVDSPDRRAGGDRNLPATGPLELHLGRGRLRGRLPEGPGCLVGFDGSLYEGRGLELTSGATGGGNNPGNLAVCFIGCYHEPESQCVGEVGHEPTLEMMQRGQLLVQTLARLEDIPTSEDDIRGHRDWPGNSTACPRARLHPRLGEFREDLTWFAALQVERSWDGDEVEVPLGVSTELWIELENTGGLPWLPGETFLAPTTPRDEASPLYDDAWPTTTRAATVGSPTRIGVEGPLMTLSRSRYEASKSTAARTATAPPVASPAARAVAPVEATAEPRPVAATTPATRRRPLPCPRPRAATPDAAAARARAAPPGDWR